MGQPCRQQRLQFILQSHGVGEESGRPIGEGGMAGALAAAPVCALKEVSRQSDRKHKDPAAELGMQHRRAPLQAAACMCPTTSLLALAARGRPLALHLASPAWAIP